ncbi:gliding motility-associated C-terminal domain-containing protein [Hymenobacter sp. 15J16-1T3B]|uniref:T9SS type B sorting domain-containing protein n=1 Tax=Hymenobacter sp. 15J16-1T3B TaxID=2886941 RepID=UPI001D111D90|nr:gliding motility-associated C-terminal domain-containing protein [Hymenobacter sp. 15J16-1T3B]MCC3159409.1 gliding motility-associated C-terminal domain-containing protein [Hymenobacter sp. 15J16-1T3B]
MTRLLPCLWVVWLTLGSWGLARPAQAQRAYFNWYFGKGAGLTFNSSPPAVLPPGPTLYYHSSSVSDSAGRLQFIAEGNTIYNRQMQVMEGGQLGGPSIFGYEVMAVPQPDRPGRYYVFVPRNWFIPSPSLQNVPPNLTYYIVDMRRQGGLGEVVGRDSLVLLPTGPMPWGTDGGYVRTDVAAVRHANGRDLWLIVKNDLQQYVSVLLDRRGLHSRPVVTPNPSGRRLLTLTPTGALLKASTDGRTLAFSSFSLLTNGRGGPTGQRMFYIEIARFDAQSGRISSAYIIPDSVRYPVKPALWHNGCGGLELSPDGSRLYVDTLLSRHIWQYDLTAGAPAAVAASHAVVAEPLSGFKGLSGAFGNNLQLGPDGRIYHVTVSSPWVSRFETPNALGRNAAFRDSVRLFAAGTLSWSGLPKAPNDLGLPPVVVGGAGTIRAASICAGEVVQFSSSLSPFVTALAYAWDFGDPASGPLNTASGQAPAHRYAQPGTYTVTLRLAAAGGQQYTTTQQVSVAPRPAVSLGADVALCTGETLVLRPAPQPPGSTYRWQDGSTAPQFTATEAGRYSLTVTNAAGCAASAGITVTAADCPDIPNVITPNGDEQNDFFVLKGLNAPAWGCRVFSRWGRLVFEAAAYQNDWNGTGQPAGVYYYELTNRRTGQRRSGWVEVVR